MQHQVRAEVESTNGRTCHDNVLTLPSRLLILTGSFLRYRGVRGGHGDFGSVTYANLGVQPRRAVTLSLIEREALAK